MSFLLRAQACMHGVHAPRKAPLAWSLPLSMVETRTSVIVPLNTTGRKHSSLVRARSSGNAGILDSPLILPGREKSLDHKRKKPPTYKVMLHNDNRNKRDYVVKVLLKVVEGLTVEDATVVMQEAHVTGVAMVIACPQDEAERYCESLRLNGLTSTIEPGK